MTYHINRHTHTLLHRHYLQVKPEVLSLFKEVVQNEFPHKVWVQRVVNHLSSPKLDKGRMIKDRLDYIFDGLDHFVLFCQRCKSAMTQIYTAHVDAQVGQQETIIFYYDIFTAESTSQLGFYPKSKFLQTRCEVALNHLGNKVNSKLCSPQRINQRAALG